jgi:hypothetical protein
MGDISQGFYYFVIEFGIILILFLDSMRKVIIQLNWVLIVSMFALSVSLTPDNVNSFSSKQ